MDEPKVAVRVSSRATARISGELRDVVFDGCETGGFLYGLRGDDKIEIATGPGPNAQRTPTGVKFDGDYIRSLDAQLYAGWGDELSVVGRWHSHPDRTKELSQVDREGAIFGFLNLEKLHSDEDVAYLELVVTERSSWDDPDFHAYVVTRDPVSGRVTVEPAEFEEVD